MKTIITILLVVFLMSCDHMETGEIKHLHSNDSIQVYELDIGEKYQHIYIAKFKNNSATTINYSEQHGKTSFVRGVIIIENDSQIVIKK